MKIEVWSDFVCPFCYIGKRRLEMALAQFPHRNQVEVEFKAFELDPAAEKGIGKNIHEAIAEKYGISMEEAKKANRGIGEQAASVGLHYDFDNMKPTNTLDAHRLEKFAATEGKGAELAEKLFHAYFTEGAYIGDHETLAAIAESAGLSREKALEVLRDPNAYLNDVRVDEAIAQQYGITGVPFFILNQKYAISGAQPLETFTSALQKVWQEEAAAPVLQDLSTEEDVACADGSCIIPGKEEK
ncbi:DsbA family oxidoreductase [Weizmannia sp. FSL W8-0676]|uniref:DsbA family oxidoreductase n=1 Tax=Weizmannia sp. FSL W8-0676 TaxID=2954703 RepID=UPI003158555C